MSMEITRHVFHIQPDGAQIRMGSRGRGNGLDTPKAKLVSRDGDLITIRVPGHKEVSGYDRNNIGNNNNYEYVPAATHTLRVVVELEERYGVTYVEALEV